MNMKNQYKECHHEHSHDCNHSQMSFFTRWMLSVLMVGLILILLRPFLIGQMFVRVVSYSAYSHYSDAIRICKKIIFIDKDNQQAWTALGFSYMDSLQVDRARRRVEKTWNSPYVDILFCMKIDILCTKRVRRLEFK